MDILHKHTPRYTSDEPNLGDMLVSRGCARAHIERVTNDATSAFQDGFDLVLVKVYIKAELQSCTLSPYLSWSGSRLASDLTMGMPWVVGAELDPRMLTAVAPFRGHLDEIRMYAGAVSDDVI